jgi:3,4-dihydroxy 2-butanone 4-phosphate synthase/GTP cyclohydrolase II
MCILIRPFIFMAGTTKEPFDTVDAAVADIAAGRMVIVTDDEARENEGDLVMAAVKVTPETVNAMLLHGRGLICVPAMEAQLRRLGVNPMVPENRESHKTDFTVSVDAAEGITTGISAYDRAATIKILGNTAATPDMLVQPGHVFPLRAKSGGVLQRAGHTEAAVDLAAMAGLPPVGVICEILNEDGSMARLPELVQFKKKHGLRLISIASLIEYRHQRDKLVEKVAESPFTHRVHGEFKLHVFRSILDGRHHYAFAKGMLQKHLPTLVRVHSENLLSDVFLMDNTYGARSLDRALGQITEADAGVLLYLEKPNSGIDIAKLTELERGEAIPSTQMDFRDYGIGAQILVNLGLEKIRLLANTKRKVVGLDGYGLEIVEHLKLS